MWKQTRMGQYENGNKKLAVSVQPGYEPIFELLGNRGLSVAFKTLEELNEHLHDMGAKSLYVPQLEKPDGFLRIFHAEGVVFITKKVNDTTVRTVRALKNFGGKYDLFLREKDYATDTLIKEALDYAEEVGSNPMTDLEVDIFEMNKHSTGSMDAIHWDIETIDNLNELLSEECKIKYKLKDGDFSFIRVRH